MVEFRKILCAVDLSELSARPLAYAGALAKWYGGQLTVMHVVPSFTPMAATTGLEPIDFVYATSRDEVLDRLRQAVAAAGLGENAVELATAEGGVAAAIVTRAVETRADLLVVGTHGRSGFDRFLLGSVAEKVLRKAPCPVLTVPPHAPATPHVDAGLRTIVCPVDFSPAAVQAFGFALDLARRADASVVLVHVIEFLPEEEPLEYAHFNVPEFRRYLLEDARQRLDRLAAGERPLPRGVKIVAVPGRAHHEILAAAGDEHAGVIVMGAQGRSGAQLAVFGSTTQQVVRGAGCPVLTVR